MSGQSPTHSGRLRRITALLLIAVLAGLGAILLKAVLNLTTGLLLGSVVSGMPAVIMASGGRRDALAGMVHDERAWMLPVVVALGMTAAVTVSRLVKNQVPGTDGVIAAVNSRDVSALGLPGAAVKLLGTALTLGSGGSGGTEGPVAQVGASLAAAVTRRLRLTEAESAAAVAVGLAAGVGALFQSPLGGALLGAELLRRRGATWRMLPPALLAAPIAFAVYGTVYGHGPMLGRADAGPLFERGETVALAGLGLVCAVLTRLYVWSFHSVARWLKPLKKWPLRTAAVAGAAVGTAGIFVPMTLGTEYGSVEAEMSQAAIASVPLWILAALPFVKIAATSLTLGSGGVGGVFGPAMLIGGTTGALCWRLAADAGLHPGPAAVYTMTGIAACLGPAVRAPLAAIVIVAGATGNILPPAGLVLAVAVSYLAVGDATLFPAQSADRAGAPWPETSRQRLISATLRRSGIRSTTKADRAPGADRPRPRERGDTPGGGSAMEPVEPESVEGIPDLTDVRLDHLAASDAPWLERAIRTARARRAASGIVFAGFNAGLTCSAESAAGTDEAEG